MVNGPSLLAGTVGHSAVFKFFMDGRQAAGRNWKSINKPSLSRRHAVLSRQRRVWSALDDAVECLMVWLTETTC